MFSLRLCGRLGFLVFLSGIEYWDCLHLGGLPWGANLEPFERPFLLLLVPVEFTLMYLPYLRCP